MESERPLQGKRWVLKRRRQDDERELAFAFLVQLLHRSNILFCCASSRIAAAIYGWIHTTLTTIAENF